MCKIYRLRPLTQFTADNTLGELETPYLWFSKPMHFESDPNDANFTAFCRRNETVTNMFDRLLGESNVLAQRLTHIGICCFTNERPNKATWETIPNGESPSICVEYDKDKIEQHLSMEFRHVRYVKDPTKLQSSTSSAYDVLWEEDSDMQCYKSLRGDIMTDSKLLDEFIKRILSTITCDFAHEKESRLIYCPENYVEIESGFKLPISRDCITKIYIKKDVKQEFVDKVNTLCYITEVMNY